MRVKTFVKYLENLREDEFSHLNDKLSSNKKNEARWDDDDELIRQKTELGMIGLELCRRQQARSMNTAPSKRVREFHYVLVDENADS